MQPCGLVNLKVKKDVTKVVDTIDIEDISEKACFCRCWRSENVSFFYNLKIKYLKCFYFVFQYNGVLIYLIIKRFLTKNIAKYNI